jgi:myo-inositol-1(or 4)-monophosphatase
MSQENQKILSFLDNTLNVAGQDLKNRFGGSLKISTKPDSSIVTEADLASEKIILTNIEKEFPEDIIFSEEAGLNSDKRTEGTYIWIVDPLDGTTNYANNFPCYCVSIGRGRFRGDGTIEVVAGGIIDPSEDSLYLAVKGGGATCNGKPTSVAKPRAFKDCFLATGFYYDQGEVLKKAIKRFEAVSLSCQSVRRDGSAALDMARTAAGIYDGFWEYGLSPWDLTAGALLITESGGKICNYPNSGDLSYNIEGEGLVCGSQNAVDEIFKLL